MWSWPTPESASPVVNSSNSSTVSRPPLSPTVCDRGDRVALVAPATGEAVAVRYAAALLGASTVYCPDAGSPARLQVFLSRIGADAVIVFPSTAAWVGGSNGTKVLAVGRVPGLPDLLTEGRSRSDGAGPEAGQVSSDDECVLVATGGTTGVSKASVRNAWRIPSAGRPRPNARQTSAGLHPAGLHRSDPRRHSPSRRRSCVPPRPIHAGGSPAGDRRRADHAPGSGRTPPRRAARQRGPRRLRPLLYRRDQSCRRRCSVVAAMRDCCVGWGDRYSSIPTEQANSGR